MYSIVYYYLSTIKTYFCIIIYYKVTNKNLLTNKYK